MTNKSIIYSYGVFFNQKNCKCWMDSCLKNAHIRIKDRLRKKKMKKITLCRYWWQRVWVVIFISEKHWLIIIILTLNKDDVILIETPLSGKINSYKHIFI